MSFDEESTIHPAFLPHVSTLINDFGCRLSPVRCKDEVCSQPASYPMDDRRYSDHFKIHLSYASHTLVWEVRLDYTAPEQPPDFLFDDESFLFSLNADLLSEKVPGLVNWQIENPQGLRDIVQQLLLLYTEYQLESMTREGSLLADQCRKLKEELKLGDDQLQILEGGTGLVFPNSTRPTVNNASVVILDLEKSVECDAVQTECRKMALEIMFRGNTATPKLYLSHTLLNILGGKNHIQLPPLQQGDECVTYVRNLCTLVGEKLRLVLNAWNKREQFHHGLFAALSDTDQLSFMCLEADPRDFIRSSYLLDFTEKRTFVLSVVTPLSGCNEPDISLKSFGNGKDMDVNLNVGNVWDPRSLVQAMIEKFSIKPKEAEEEDESS